MSAPRRPSALARSPLRLTAVSWSATLELGLADWVDQGRRLGVMGRGAAWWIGDWLQYGNGVYGEKYVRAARITGYDVQSLMNMVYVASHFEISRRRETLSWSHHADLAALPSKQQDYWLDRAIGGHMAVRDLRDELRRARRVELRLRAVEDGEEVTAELVPAPAPDEDPEFTCPECGCRFCPSPEEGEGPEERVVVELAAAKPSARSRVGTKG